MRLSWTLTRYFCRQLLINFGAVFGVFLALILMGDLVELTRRTSGNSGINFTTLLTMALLQLPTLSERALPFAVLFGSLWTFIRFGRSGELVVTRASGVSIWQFLTPCVGVALALGTFAITVYNPLSARLVAKFEQLEATHLRGRPSLLAVSSSGLWLRQADAGGQSVIHALRVSDQGIRLEDVIIFLYEGTDTFSGRVDADWARLRPGYWELGNAIFTSPGTKAVHHPSYTLPTTLTPERIQESFASPETLSFWDLPEFIAVLEEAGFSAVRHRLHWHATLALPLLLSSMVLIAAAFALRASNRATIAMVVLGAVLAGFLFFFITDLALALGRAGSLPVALAAWAPASVSALLGISMLLHFEDG